MQASADRNLLFGILALQMDFVTRDQLVAGMNAWVLHKSRPLGGILVEQHSLSGERCALLESLVAEHLRQHGNDPQQSLVAYSPLTPWGRGAGAEVRSLCDDLQKLDDAAVQASLGHLAPLFLPRKEQRGHAQSDPNATRSPVDGETSAVRTRFCILRPHAEGALGRVSVAMDAELHREVALKEIQEKYADDPASRTRFLLEAEITGGLEHPGIVPVYGIGCYADGRPFYAMRFIRGESLEDALGRFHKNRTTDFTNDPDTKKPGDFSSVKSVVDFSGLEFRQLLGRFVDVCNALAYAHSRGVVHRDIKPGNIMLCKYGETLIVDWGLAKAGFRSQGSEVRNQGSGVRNQGSGVSGRRSEVRDQTSEVGGQTDSPAHAVSPSPLHPLAPQHDSTDEVPLQPPSASDYAKTMAGSAVGSPAFMSPEQAAGRLDLIGPASDVYSLGATLFALLTGEPPYARLAIDEILRRVQAGDIPSARQIRADVPQALNAICKKAMAHAPADRYATPLALAKDIEHWLADEPVGAYRERWTKRLARWRRRHNTLVTAAALVLFTLCAAGIVGLGILRREQARARAAGRLEALRDSAPSAVPALLAELKPDHDSVVDKLRAQWNDRALSERQRLRVGLALAADDADVRRKLVDLAQKSDDPHDVLLVRDALAPFGNEVHADLWKRTQSPGLSSQERLRLWAMLATLDADGAGWKEAAAPALDEVMATNPLHLGAWQQALAPIRRSLLPALHSAYRSPNPERRQLAAAILADYAADNPKLLVELLLDADTRQFGLLYPAAAAKAPAEELVAELAKTPPRFVSGKEIFAHQGTLAKDDATVSVSVGMTLLAKRFEVNLAQGTAYQIKVSSDDFDSFVVVQDSSGNELGFDDDSGGGFNSALDFTPPRTAKYRVFAALLPNPALKSAGSFNLAITETPAAEAPSQFASRQANAAIALLRRGLDGKVWPLLAHTPDPTLRSHLVHRFGPQGVDAELLIKRFDEEKDVSIRRALLLSLGSYGLEAGVREPVLGNAASPLALRARLLPKLLDLYKVDPDAGLHAAAAWLLTHWGHAEELLDIDRKLATPEPPTKNRKSKIENPTWWVNSQGQTMIALPGDVEFQMGSPPTEPDRQPIEQLLPRRIERSFALAAAPVTVEQFLRFQKAFAFPGKNAPTRDCPIIGVSWHQAAAYCNWLSQQEGMPRDQWCYEVDAQGQVTNLQSLGRNRGGYRLPTQTEWEYACRAGATTSRYYGDSTPLLDHYAWHQGNSGSRSHPIGRKKPNDFGLFDMHGNVWTWCHDRDIAAVLDARSLLDDPEDLARLANQVNRSLRGGSFLNPAGLLRCAFRNRLLPTARFDNVGFRPARTLLTGDGE